MESIDETRYRKYFSPRRPQSRWSEKNRRLAEKLIFEGKMTSRGREAIEEAKRCGNYETVPRMVITDDHVEELKTLLASSVLARKNYEKMSPSAKRAYAGGYFSVKTEAGRRKKLLTLIERLELNLDPMASLAKAKAEK